MYCGQCGKKVMENMLFCPFCGSPIVIPEQDEAQPNVPAEAEETLEKPLDVEQTDWEESLPSMDVREEESPRDAQRPVSLFAAYDAAPQQEAPDKHFVPLSFDFEVDMDDQPPEAQSAPVDIIPEFRDQNEEGDVQASSQRPTRRNAPELMRPENAQRRAANTYIPIKEITPTDMFMDGFDAQDDYDDYDADDYDAPVSRDRCYRDEIEDDFDFEEPESGSFFQRHIRGIVGLLLLLMVAIICLIWAFSGKGQLTLAQMNLAWTAQPYADLGYAAYQQDSDLLAARYYEKALSRDGDNYEYAHSAMVAYYEADETESAAAMLKKCIELDPDNPEPYAEMLILYPDVQSRPWDITELVRQGYQRTGDASLKLD